MSFFEKYTNSKFFVICDYIYRLVILFFLMLISIVCGLVFLTLIPSIQAFVTCMKSGKTKDCPIIEGYFVSLFHHFKKSCALSVIAVLFSLLMTFNTYYFYLQIADYNTITIGKNKIEYVLNTEDMYTIDKDKNVYLYSGKKAFIVDSKHLDYITITESNGYYSDGLAIVLNQEGAIQYYLLGKTKSLIEVNSDGSLSSFDSTCPLWANDPTYEGDNILFNLKNNIPENGYVLLMSSNQTYSLGEDLYEILGKYSNEERLDFRLFNEQVIQNNKDLNKTSNKIGSLVCYYLCLLIDITLVATIILSGFVLTYFPYMNLKQTIKYSFLVVVSLPVKTILFIVLSIAFVYIYVLVPFLLMISPTLYLFLVYALYHKDFEDLVDDNATEIPLDISDLLEEKSARKKKKTKTL